MLYRVKYPHLNNTVVIICGTNNLGRDKPRNGWMYSGALLYKRNKLKIVVFGILPRNKRNEQYNKIQV